MDIWNQSFDIDRVLQGVEREGFYFARGALSQEWLLRLRAEMDGLDLQVGDHVRHPINPGSVREVRQLHARSYHGLDHVLVPEASALCWALADSIGTYLVDRGIHEWLPNEIGYQYYRGSTDWISPHRDRRTDRILSVTVTIEGYAWMKMYEPSTDPVNYAKLREVHRVMTGPGTVMFLRAPGFGSGKQVIHDVMPPIKGSRRIVNLRMRAKVLPSPREEGSLE